MPAMLGRVERGRTACAVVGRGEGGPGRGERGLHGSCHFGRCAGDIRCAALPAIWIWSKRWPHNL